ncbi:hypothetical protein DICPUDRAFT_57640 [Dictyostelium purpureum]|uniref:Glucosidase 2 subunit beta n=1 Tax=Dictyostelium purpureum TaxID=5786 RepID=F0ZWW6_DICPU|nr:uncharacterized protein DICPUDRAFT_57640 [Dictyostelium purpureum]EGC31570.1 hypothetical protein DICPUDRAFT_57640 [Dictyostelium purpureum]|eukprot:XP_003291912.1 hypothetical protein DICPUDRAFT_57640 [Dictyostelium purpureum]
MRVILYLCIIIFTFSYSVKSITPQYGVAPEELEFYKENKVFNCLRSNKEIPFSQVNDDYCDCPDGTDEPGTAACSNGHFWCTNKGHKGAYIPSSYVNDGVCDCCDGSDEYKSSIKCENKCNELGEATRKKHNEEVERYTNGLKKKKEMEEEGSRIIKEKFVTLETLKKEIDPIKSEIKELEVLVERKRSEKDDEEKRLKDAKDAEKQKDTQKEEATPTPTNTEETVEGEAKVGNDDSNNNNNDNDEDLKPTVEEKLTSELLETVSKGKDNENNNNHNNNNNNNNNINTIRKDNDNSENKSILDSFYKLIVPFLPNSFVSFKDMGNLEGLENELSNKKSSLKQKQDEIEKIEKVLGYDTGVNNVFLPLNGKCFDFKTKEYTYTVCPFDKASQGHTSLGKFESWKDGHNQMVFENGQQCWGGPKRSIKVFMECGSENELYDVNEPGKCEYTIKFRTPAMCTEEHLKVLKLESDHGL